MTTDINTMFDPNDPRLTAYALGELHGDELTEFERLLAESAAARDALGEIRETTGWLRNELAAEPAFALSAEQHQRLEQHVTLGTGAKENPLTLTLSPQGRGEGTKPALAGVSSAIAPSLPVVTVAPADLRREQVRHRWAVLAAAAATAALAATVMLWPPSTPLLSRSPSRLSISDQQLAQVDARHRIKGIAADISLEQRQFNEEIGRAHV